MVQKEQSSNNERLLFRVLYVLVAISRITKRNSDERTTTINKYKNYGKYEKNWQKSSNSQIKY